MDKRKNFGSQGENIAKSYLTHRGYVFITQNYRQGRLEIDLIFKNKNRFIFVEVKTRFQTEQSLKENPLTNRQTKNLQKVMVNYCLENNIKFENAQLDLIIILVNRKTQRADLSHYPDIL